MCLHRDYQREATTLMWRGLSTGALGARVGQLFVACLLSFVPGKSLSCIALTSHRWTRHFHFVVGIICRCRSHWTWGVRHELSLLARTLGSWVWIPLRAWMSVCVYSVCIVLCVGSGPETGWSPSKESYRLCIGSRNWKSGQCPTKGCRGIIIIIIVIAIIVIYYYYYLYVVLAHK
jgi:hypothetical protein